MKRFIALLLAALMTAAVSAACSSGDTNDNQLTTADEASANKPAETITTADEAQTGSSNTKLTQSDEVTTTANVTSSGAIDATDLFSDRDLRQTADLSEAVYYDLKDNSDITITKAGVYVISGSASDASVVIEAGDDDKVQLVLNGATINNSSAPAVYVKNADKVFVTTVEGTANDLSVTGTFTADGDTNTDAVIFSKDDVIINGLGTLNINSTANGISGKDDVKITGGTINITSKEDAIEANESIAVADGSITINSSKDGLHAENNDDNKTGFVYICGGAFNIKAASDGVQATTIAQVDGGELTIDASEAIEGTYVQINGGTISISASDDGINGSNKSSAYSVKVEINGGDITIDMGQGDTDAIDANGDLIINGGKLNINANSPFDYDGNGELNGGEIYVNGTKTEELTNQFMGGGPGGMGGDPGMGGNPGGMGGGSGMGGAPNR